MTDSSRLAASTIRDSEEIGVRIPLGISDLETHPLFLRAAPDKLFHYTTLNGLRGIIESKTLWLTKAAYLNDRSELKHAITLFQQEAISQAVALPDKSADVGELLREAAHQLDSFQKTNICLASFCEDGDLLSQWRGYGSSGSGVALGFSGQALERVNGTGWARLLRCLYEPSEQMQVIRDLVRLLTNAYTTCTSGVSSDKHATIRKNLIGYFNTTFLQVAPVLKNKHFAEEREWRIVTLPRNSTDLKFRALVSNERVSQYYIYDLLVNASGNHDFLSSVVIGPTAEPKLVSDAVWTLCNQSKVGLNALMFSQIPYRG